MCEEALNEHAMQQMMMTYEMSSLQLLRALEDDIFDVAKSTKAHLSRKLRERMRTIFCTADSIFFLSQR